MPTFCLVRGVGNAHWPDGEGLKESKAYSWHTSQNLTHRHTLSLFPWTRAYLQTTRCVHVHTNSLSEQYTWAWNFNTEGHVGTLEAQRDAEGPPPNPKPEPLGVAVFPLLGACMSQRSGHSGGEPVEGGKVLRSSPLFLTQGGLRLVVALQGAPASAEPQASNRKQPGLFGEGL